MPGKSRRRRGKQGPARKARGRQQRPATGQATAPPGHVESGIPQDTVTPAPGASLSAPPARQAVRHPFIGVELRAIGILAVLMLVVLFALKLVFT